MRYLNLRSSILIALLILLPSTFIPLLSQSETIITVGIPEWQRDIFDDEIFDDFEAAHPGVKVVPVYRQPSGFYYSGGGDEEALNSSFDMVLEGVTEADLHWVQTSDLTIEMTRAGMFLDLTPLISDDPSFDRADFAPTVLESFQWDNGIWMVPVRVSPIMLIYNAAKFDEAGLPYPNENWTLTDLVNAADALSERDAEGEVTLPGLTGWNIRHLVISLLGEGLIDRNVIPNEPRLNTPELQALIEEWSTLVDTEVVQAFGDFDSNEVAMMIDSPYRLQGFIPQGSNQRWEGSLLPGGRAGLQVTGFAVSAGTTNPELAYELAKYLSLSVDVAATGFGELPARQSLVGVTPDEDSQQFVPPPPNEDLQALIDHAIANGIPVAETQFYNYISTHFEMFMGMYPPDMEMPELPSLDEVQQTAVDVLAAAEARRSTQVVVVATIVPTPIIQEGQVVLKFQLGMPFSPIPNRELWDEFLTEFVANDPTVGNVDLLTGFGSPAPGQEIDCYYTFDNMVPSADLTTLMALDPFMDADPSFDESDILGNTLSQVQRENATWGYPMTLQPSLISYNSLIFEEAGIDAPAEDWTIDEFTNTLQALMDSDPDLDYAFDSGEFGPMYLYMLITAYGGNIADYSTTPVTYNLQDPDTINAIRQALDLAKSGAINYRKLDNSTGGGGFSGSTPLQGTNMTSMAWDLGYRVSEQGQTSEFVNPTRFTLYPRGNRYTPMSYTIGTAYITNTSVDPEACYRLISEVSRRPELLLGVPARRSMVQGPEIATLFGQEVADFFSMFANQLDAPDAVIIPNTSYGGGSFTSFFESIWINQAFDNYVLEDGDLEADLNLAAENITAYRTCVGDDGTPPDLSTMEQDELEEYFARYTTCVVEVDPTLQDRFGGQPESD